MKEEEQQKADHVAYALSSGDYDACGSTNASDSVKQKQKQRKDRWNPLRRLQANGGGNPGNEGDQSSASAAWKLSFSSS